MKKLVIALITLYVIILITFGVLIYLDSDSLKDFFATFLGLSFILLCSLLRFAFIIFIVTRILKKANNSSKRSYTTSNSYFYTGFSSNMSTTTDLPKSSSTTTDLSKSSSTTKYPKEGFYANGRYYASGEGYYNSNNCYRSPKEGTGYYNSRNQYRVYGEGFYDKDNCWRSPNEGFYGKDGKYWPPGSCYIYDDE